MVLKERYGDNFDEITDTLYSLEGLISYLDIEVNSVAKSSEREYYMKNMVANEDQAYAFLDGVRELKQAVQDIRERFAALTHTELDD